MIRFLFFAGIIIFTCNHAALGFAADTESMMFKEHIQQANKYIKAYRHFEAAEELKKATLLGGAKHPSLHMRLGILYYGLGLIPEAIEEAEEAVELAPSSKWYKYDLAKFYFVAKNYEKAEGQLFRLLKLDPGFTLGYHYLAELYYRQKKHDLAWLSLNRARLLGHKEQRLSKKLALFSSHPQEIFSQTGPQTRLFRFVKFANATDAQKALDKIRNGTLLENLELELGEGQNNDVDFGIMVSSELNDSIAGSLAASPPYSPPVIIKTGSDYRIIQAIVPFEPESWQKIVDNRQTTATAGGVEQLPAQDPVPPLPGQPITADSPFQNKDIIPNADTASLPVDTAANPSKSELWDGHLYASRLAAFYALENWKQKWAARDFGAYLKCYSKDFKPPESMTYDAWVQRRRQSLSRPKFVEVKIEDTVIEFLSATQLLATFKQTYQSNTYSDVVIKTLTLVKEQDGWKIQEEREIRKL